MGVQERKLEVFASQPDGGRQASILHGHKDGGLGQLYQKLCAGYQALLPTGGPRYVAQGTEPLEEVRFNASQKLKLSLFATGQLPFALIVILHNYNDSL